MLCCRYLLQYCFTVYFITSIISPNLSENWQIIAQPLMFAYIVLITLILLGTLSHKFTLSFVLLSKEHPWRLALIFVLALITSLSPLILSIPLLEIGICIGFTMVISEIIYFLFLCIKERYSSRLGDVHTCIKLNYASSVIYGTCIITLLLITVSLAFYH